MPESHRFDAIRSLAICLADKTEPRVPGDSLALMFRAGCRGLCQPQPLVDDDGIQASARCSYLALEGRCHSSLEILFRTRRRFKGGFGWQKTRAHKSLARVPTKTTSFSKVSFFCHSAKSHAPPGLFALPLERKFAPRASSGRFAEEPRERARTESISGKTKSKQSTPLRLSPGCQDVLSPLAVASH